MCCPRRGDSHLPGRQATARTATGEPGMLVLVVVVAVVVAVAVVVVAAAAAAAVVVASSSNNNNKLLLVARHSGTALVFDRRTFPVLRNTSQHLQLKDDHLCGKPSTS